MAPAVNGLFATSPTPSMYSFMDPRVQQHLLPVPLVRRDVDDFRACAKIFTLDTRAQFWDMSAPGKQDDILDDAALRAKLAGLGSFWGACDKQATVGSTKSKFVLVTALGEPSRRHRALQIRPSTLQAVMNVAGVSEKSTKDFFSHSLPSMYSRLHYEDDDEKPTALNLFFRCPKQSNSIIGVMRVQFSTRDCFVFLPCCLPEDVEVIRARCRADINLLQTHPYYLLSFIYEHRFQRWTDWIALLWKELTELETATNMTHPQWKLTEMDAERLRSLSTADTLLNQLHATHLRLCHSHTIMSFANRFGKFCTDALIEVEKRRLDIGLAPLSSRHRSALEEAFLITLARCDSMAERLTELSNRLMGQINVSYNLIAQKDSKINFAIAKLQAQDSRMVKGIAVLTLLFLPSTLVATLWTTNLFKLEGDTNWQVYLAISVVLTCTVFGFWGAYGQFSRSRWEARWPAYAMTGNDSHSAHIPTNVD